jgi:hypothetical protein
VLEILSHVNKRVRGHGEIKMPLDALLAQYAAPGAAPLVRNFALVYLEMAYERVPEDARSAAVRSAQTPWAQQLPPVHDVQCECARKQPCFHALCRTCIYRAAYVWSARPWSLGSGTQARAGMPCGDTAPLDVLRPTGAAGCTSC